MQKTPNCFFNLGNSFSHSCHVEVYKLIGGITPGMNLALEEVLLSYLLQNSLFLGGVYIKSNNFYWKYFPLLSPGK